MGESAIFPHFDPRPTEQATNLVDIFKMVFVVSIHAPVKEATAIAGVDRHFVIVSIHAPVKEATPYQ